MRMTCWKKGARKAAAQSSEAASAKGCGGRIVARCRLDEFVDHRVAAAFEARAWLDEAHNDAIAQVLAGMRRQLREEVATAVGELRAELHVAKTWENAPGQVIDLPAFPLGRKNDAA